jgi:hypothetical protein
MPLRLDLLLPRRAPRFSRRYRGKGASQCFRLVPWRNIQASHSSFVWMTGTFTNAEVPTVLSNGRFQGTRTTIAPDGAAARFRSGPRLHLRSGLVEMATTQLYVRASVIVTG